MSIFNCLVPRWFLEMELVHTDRDLRRGIASLFRAAGCQGAFAICAGARSIFEHATGRRITADLVEFGEADAVSAGPVPVSGPALATAALACRAIGTSGVADRNRPRK